MQAPPYLSVVGGGRLLARADDSAVRPRIGDLPRAKADPIEDLAALLFGRRVRFLATQASHGRSITSSEPRTKKRSCLGRGVRRTESKRFFGARRCRIFADDPAHRRSAASRRAFPSETGEKPSAEGCRRRSCRPGSAFGYLQPGVRRGCAAEPRQRDAAGHDDDRSPFDDFRQSPKSGKRPPIRSRRCGNGIAKQTGNLENRPSAGGQ